MTYNDMAVALVDEYIKEGRHEANDVSFCCVWSLIIEMVCLCSQPALVYDEKNIRRRIYDALNVLMAINIIGKVSARCVLLLVYSSSFCIISGSQRHCLART